MTYSKLDLAVNRFANVLQSLGLGQGQNMMLILSAGDSCSLEQPTVGRLLDKLFSTTRLGGSRT
jgi:hypothetical protein